MSLISYNCAKEIVDDIQILDELMLQFPGFDEKSFWELRHAIASGSESEKSWTVLVKTMAKMTGGASSKLCERGMTFRRLRERMVKSLEKKTENPPFMVCREGCSHVLRRLRLKST